MGLQSRPGQSGNPRLARDDAAPARRRSQAANLPLRWPRHAPDGRTWRGGEGDIALGQTINGKIAKRLTAKSAQSDLAVRAPICAKVSVVTSSRPCYPLLNFSESCVPVAA